MMKYWINAALLRVVVPGTFTACAVWRPTGLSLIYLIMMLISPFIPVPTSTTMKKSTGHYLKSCIALTLITGCIQFAFQIILLSVSSIWEKFTENCSLLEEIFRHIGLVRMDHASVFEIFFWLIPEIAALPVMIIVYILCRRFTSEEKKDLENTPLETRLQPIIKKPDDKNIKIINFLGRIGTYVVLASLCYAAAMTPSVEGGFYFLMFLGAATWWACNRELSRGFAVVCRILMAVVVVHIIVLLSYQNQWPQEFIPVKGNWSRYFGLDAYYITNCSDPRHTQFNPDDKEWTQNGYAYSLRLFWLYYVLALQSQFLFKKPLMRFGSGRTGLLQDSTGSVIVQDGHNDDNIQMQSITEDAPEDRMGPIEHVIMAVYSIFQLFAHSSYLGTNIIMMTWSIMYHSWTTFVFLLWALILWMAPNKRAIMMKCSPFIVFYGTVLLLVGYVYSMNLTPEELPDVISGVEMSEIGFPKADTLNSWHLVVKSGFMTMFWITMRQYMAERLQAHQTSTLRDMVAPLHVSMSTAIHHDTPEIKSQFMKDVGIVVKKLLTKFWIVVVAIMLFTSGITGERMTVFRIIYMMLFLFFLISFQLSWSAWRKMMYGFWIAVIVYSVVMLILVYTYQFKNFLEYWKYLHINERLQKDIGLERYATKDLFVRLLTPTFFVIITVLQIHYFHDDFLELTNIENVNVSVESKRESLTPPIATTSTVDVLLNSGEEPSTIFSLRQLKHMSKLERAAFFRKTVQQLKDFYSYFWLILEIHMQKIIFTSLMLLCLNDVCAINFIFVITIAVTMNFKRQIQIMGINGMSVAIAILMIAKMLYQIEYIDHRKWDVNCTSEIPDSNNNHTVNHTKTFNIAEWIGMDKAKPGMLPDLLKGYIGIVTVTTIRAIITVRQCFYRYSKGESMETPQIMFPKIKRADADKGIAECLKFFLNYGFYKFGLEFCLIGIVALIGTRLDFYSVIYGVWLLVLFAQTRRTAAKIWPFFRVFAIVMLIVQYACVVAPPTWLCIKYPWSANINLHEWMYFPDPEYPPDPTKLVCDFFLLYMIIRQSIVFNIEAQSEATNTEFVAGHNYSVYKDMDKPNFINPVKDYVSHIHCWLDVVKRGSMMSCMWITLSMMFLAGTNRTNLFSLGYLIGSFIFLWQGSDFYLRPVRVILRWWNYLIGYNVSVIFCKTILQGLGCVYIEELEAKACWLIQLLGVACLKKVDNSILNYGPNHCEVSREDIGMVWDGICFAFLIIQKRLFKSYYFFHIVDETKAMSILASRGAELLEDLHRNRIEFQENLDRAVLQKIKLKMDKIKADQLRIHGPSYTEPSSHKVDSIYPRDRPLYRQRVPKTNREAVRSGDYYMFDDFDDDDDDVTDLIPDSEMEIDEDEQRRKQRLAGRRMTISELMSTLFKTDIEIATHVAMYGGTAKDALRLRRQSVPLSRKKSSMSYLSAQSDTETAAVTEGPSKKASIRDEDRGSTLGGKDDESRRTSKPFDSQDDFDYDSSSTPEDNKEQMKTRISILTYFKFFIELINSFMISATKYLNKFSRDYRYIRRVLAKEKTNLKAKSDFRMGVRLGINQIWQPIPVLKERSETEESSGETSKSRGELRREKSESQSSMLTRTQVTPMTGEEEPELSEVDQPVIIQLLASIWFGILAHSTFVCYFMIFLHQIKNASVLSTPLPLMVFFWGSLTIPRPSKTFWVTIIAYTEAIVIIKCMFQLELIQWSQHLPYNKPMETPRIIGVEKKNDYALWDLLLLLMVFFHRFMLKSLGQWTTPYATRKIIPSQMTVGTLKSSPTNSRNKTQLQWENEDHKQPPKSQQTTSRDPGVGTSTDEVDLNNQHQIESDEGRLVEIRNEETYVCDTEFSTAVKMTVKKYCEPGKIFFDNILSPDGKEKTNVYAYMFLCDFFNFLLIIFGFSYFGTQQGDGGVKAYFEENRVPMPFLSMMLLQFALIVTDRALYLRKSIFGKLIFHYVLVFGIHIWMFFVLPGVTGRQFSNNLPPQIWYIVKCFYLLLSAYQLRLGYPTRILGNFLCKNYSIINYCLFKVFMLVPFLFELRAVMDWIWTDTSMTVMDWFKMEDIFASIYQIKCMRGLESDFPQPRGVKKAQMSKYMVGGGALFVIIGVIWFPLLLFALGGTVGMANIPSEVSLSIRVGSHEPIYITSAQDSSILQYNNEEFHTLRSIYSSDRAASTFLENYDPLDVAVVKLSKSSQRFWGITPLEKKKLQQELLNNQTSIGVRVEWKISRRTDAKDFSGVSPTIRDIQILPFINGEFNPVRTNLSELLSSDSTNSTNTFIALDNVFPKFLKVTSKSTAVVKQLMRSSIHTESYPLIGTDNGQDPDYLYRNVTLQLASDTGQQWWMVSERCDDPIYNELLNQVPMNNCSQIVMFLFNDKVFPESLSFLSGFGILGLYTTGVILVSQIIRRLVSDMASKIMFDDMPYVDRILRLCLDIYLVRESNELSLEEDLFAKLIFLYRSPETLIRWTRPPEPNDEEDDGGNDDNLDDVDNNYGGNVRVGGNDDDDHDSEDDDDDDNDDNDDVRVENEERKKDK
ncbi:piezo-type mechanosensitive ion channel component isoform X2 [Chelonus insularis]|uniref:piezo-type mechanosensitive ion channel component isoform X2 n=1 Tax=Chelonus insularis TaxID=460826 RepID=UPI001589CB3D|nr:piezo-type mechanosensitive ion channel component isoform X2 [Chelonus insularis]